MKALFVGVGSIGTRHIKDFYNICNARFIDVDIYVMRRKIEPLVEPINSMVAGQIIEINEEDLYDVIFITNPTNLHYHTLKKVRDHGKFFFIEKPIFDNYNYEFDALGLDEKNTYVAAPMRHTKIYKELSNIVSNSKVFSSRIICSSYLPEWRPNIDYRKNYSAIKEMGGGVYLDLIHEIDYMLGLFGEPRQCHCFHGKYSNLEITSDDLAVYIMEYEDKLCEIHLDYFGRKYNRTCTIFTEEGTYIADFSKETIETPEGKIIDCDEGADSEFTNEMKCFISFVADGSENINPPKTALVALKIALG